MKKITSAFLVYLLLAHSAFALSLSGDDWKNPLRTKTWTPPSVSDTLVGLTAPQSFQNKTFDRSLNSITNLNITNTDVSSSAAIAYSKLASLLTGQVLCGNAGAPTACTMSGGASIGATGIVTLNNSSIITQLLTGYTPSTGTVSSSDSILQAIQKVDGNDQLKVAKSVATTAGDLYGSSASSTPARVPVGNDGDVLSGDSSQLNKWTTRQILESTNDLSQLNGYENLNTWATGNSAIVMGGGTLNGVFAKETADPLNLSATYKYTQGASALNDYMCTPAKPVKRGFKGPTVFVGTPFNYDGSSGDIQASVYDVTNSVVLNTFSTVSIPSSSSSPTQMMSGVFPSSTNSYRICYQVKTANSGKIFSFGPIKSTKSLADFGTVQGISSQYSFINQTATFGNVDITGALTESVGSGIYSYNPSNGVYTANRSAQIIGSASFSNSSGATTEPTILKNGSSVRGISSSVATANFKSQASANFNVVAGDTWKVYNNAVGSTSAQWITFTAIATSTDIASPTQQVSSDTITFTFKSSAIVSTDPVGTFNTYSYGANGNSSTICTTAPTQTTSDMSLNGVRVFARAYNTAGSCSAPSRVEIKLPTNLKSTNVVGYSFTGKSTPFNFTTFLPNSTQQYGTRTSYGQTSGILQIEAGVAFQLSSNTSAYVGLSQASSSISDGYFVFDASSIPSITSIPQIGNNYTPGIGELRSETFFVRYTGAGGGSTVCSTGDCVLLQKGNGVSKIQFSSTGVYILTPTRKYLDMYCTATVTGATNYLGSQINEYNSVAGTITFQSGVNATATNSFGTVSCIGFY